jgi:hypothetical protein
MPCDAPVMTVSLRSMSMTILVDINREHLHPMARAFVVVDEVRPLDVPMSLLGQQCRVDRVCQPPLRTANRDRLRIGVEPVQGFVC